MINPGLVRRKAFDMHQVTELNGPVADQLFGDVGIEMELSPLDILVQAVAQKVQLAPAQFAVLVALPAQEMGGLVELQDGFSVGHYALDLFPAAIEVASDLAVHGHYVVLPDDFHALLQSQHISDTLHSSAFIALIVVFILEFKIDFI